MLLVSNCTKWETCNSFMLDDSRLPENIKSKSRGVLKSHIFDKNKFLRFLLCLVLRVIYLVSVHCMTDDCAERQSSNSGARGQDWNCGEILKNLSPIPRSLHLIQFHKKSFTFSPIRMYLQVTSKFVSQGFFNFPESFVLFVKKFSHL